MNASVYRCQSAIERNLLVDFWVICLYGNVAAVHWCHCVVVVAAVVMVAVAVAAAGENLFAEVLDVAHFFLLPHSQCSRQEWVLRN